MNSCTCPQWEPNVYAKHTAERQISMDCPIHGEPTTGQICARIRELDAEVAALREARGVRVKPLMWEAFGTMAFIAQAPLFGRLRVEQFGRGNTWTVCFSVPGYCDTFLAGEWADADAAKAAAQADYERRILAALEPAPVTPAQAARVLLCDQDAMRTMCRAAASSRAHDDEGQFEPLLYLINFGGENKTRMVIFAAIYDAIRALADAGEAGDV